MRAVGERILPGASVDEVIEHLDARPDRADRGRRRVPAAGTRTSSTSTIAELNGTHFDIAAPVQRCEAMIAPPGGAAAMYYTGPSEDFTRPGRTWYPTHGQDPLPAVGRGVDLLPRGRARPSPAGRAGAVPRRRAVSATSARSGFVSGHGEGWALYAERLMGELGYLDDPAYELGMLARAGDARGARDRRHRHAPRARRSPASERYHPGETWTPELALPFVIERSRVPRATSCAARSTATSAGPARRSATRSASGCGSRPGPTRNAAHGRDFDLKAFHSYALDLGGMGLGPLRDELAALLSLPPMTDALDGFTETDVHLRRRRRDPCTAAGPARASSSMQRDAGHHAARRRLRPPRRRRRLHGRDAVARSASPAARCRCRYVAEVVHARCASRSEFSTWALNRTSPVIDVAARARPRPARAVRRTGRRRGRHVLHRRLRARRWRSTTTMLAPVLSQPSLPFAGRQGRASARSGSPTPTSPRVAALDAVRLRRLPRSRRPADRQRLRGARLDRTVGTTAARHHHRRPDRRLRRLGGVRGRQGHPVAVQHQHGAGAHPRRVRVRRRARPSSSST